MRRNVLMTLVLGLALLSASPVLAGPLSSGLGKLDESVKGTGLEGSSVESTVGTVIKAVLAMVGTIFLVLTIYAGILWMTASGNEEQVTKATGIIKAAIIGLAITMSAYAITYFVASKVGGGQGATPELGCCVGGNNNTTCAPKYTSDACSDAARWVSGVCPNSCGEYAGK